MTIKPLLAKYLSAFQSNWKKIPLLDRWLLGELLPPLLFAIAAFTVVSLSVGVVFELIRRIVESGLSFQIAINVLNIVKRELTNEEVLKKETQTILLNLLKDSDEANIKQLAKQIEKDDIKLDNVELQEALIEITKKKISVDNPEYSTYKKLIK